MTYVSTSFDCFRKQPVIFLSICTDGGGTDEVRSGAVQNPYLTPLSVYEQIFFFNFQIKLDQCFWF